MRLTEEIAAIFLLVLSGSGVLVAQAIPAGHDLLLRRYHEGEQLNYHMKGINENWHYEIEAEGIVKKDSAGNYFEEYGWSNLVSDNQKVVLSPAGVDFRQQLTLDPNSTPRTPNLAQVDPRLIGPTLDFMTFYVDLWLAVKTGQLAHPGDHFYFKRGSPNSWADGTYVLTGEDSIDFDFTLKAVNASDKTAIVVVRHVPPAQPEVKLSAVWMQAPVADTPNNWVQVNKTKDGKYLAAVGKETFTVELTVSLTDGKILSASMDNPVQTIERECEDAALTECSAPKPHAISRKIEISLR